MKTVLDANEVGRALTRMAHQIVESNRGTDDLVVLGIPTRGVPLARRLAAIMGDAEGQPVQVGELDVTMYRDDLRRHPTRAVGRTVIPVSLDGCVVVLVDDVLFSGRTVAAALDAMKDIGRPRSVQLAVLIDRGHRELPISADHVGKHIPTGADERVQVRLVETDGVDEVAINRPGGA